MPTRFRRWLFFKLNRVIGSRCEACYRELLAWERLDPGELARRRAVRLDAVLKHAATSVPFYRERVSPAEPFALASFPVLSRDDVRSHFKELMTDRLRAEQEGAAPRQRGYSWVSVDTGGSTGIPTTVIHDRDFRDFDRASRLYAMHLCGFPFGTPYFRLWGSMKDINQMKDSPGHRLVAHFAGEELLNAFQMEADDMTRYANRIAQSRIHHLMGYVDAVHELALHIRKRRLGVKPLGAVMACGGTVTADIRRTIGEVFSARVHNKYGSRDCGDMACECREGGIHILANRYVIETVDERGRAVPSGEVGRLLVTVLGNTGFPLIRYDIGDMGTLSEDVCACGRTFPLLASIEGRTMEFLTSTTGGHVSPVCIRHLLGVAHNPGTLHRFQLIQDDAVRFTLKLEWDRTVDDAQAQAHVAGMVADLKQVLGRDADITVESSEQIPAAKSGKFMATINRTRV